MTSSDVRRPLRGVRIGVAIVALMWLLWMGAPLLGADVGFVAFMGAIVCVLALVVWWVFFSRAPWVERIGALVVGAVGVVAVRPLVDPSISGAMMGWMLPMYALPTLSLGLVAAIVVSRRWSDTGRRAAIVVGLVLASSSFMLIRTGGIMGLSSDIHWRWTPTPEERMLAAEQDEPAPLAPAAVQVPSAPVTPATTTGVSASDTTKPLSGSATPVTASAETIPAPRSEWSGFRGSNRDGAVRGTGIATDWAKTPPAQVWRRAVGPGWSSFAVLGHLIYTQEQRGEFETVSAYDLSTGAPVWRHRDKIRFYESNAGAGPRATPSIAHGRVYALGATGRLNALDAATGAVIWTRDAQADTSAKVPGWGFAGSPLIVDGTVIVATSGRVVAYDAASGTQKWIGPERGGGYASPQLLTIANTPQVLLVSGTGVVSLAPADGRELWSHSWDAAVGLLQPALTSDGDVIVPGSDGMGGIGLTRISVKPGAVDPARGIPTEWTVESKWTSRGLKPYFSDFVVHNGYAFGFDGTILSCVDVSDGVRKWKGGRYGSGQMVLLADQDLILVMAEEGDIALIKAAPDQFTELARVPAINGKTWNHPIVVGDLLLVRNAEEMAAFRLAPRAK